MFLYMPEQDEDLEEDDYQTGRDVNELEEDKDNTLLTKEEIQERISKLQSRLRRTFEYDSEIKGFDVTEEDDKILYSYKIDINRVQGYLRDICSSQKLRPFERNLPVLHSFGFNVLCVIIVVGYLYSCFIIL